MKKLLIYMLLLCSGWMTAQDTYGYYIEGDHIVFKFDVRDYSKVTIDDTDIVLELEDIHIKTVAVAGTFNDWQGIGWDLKQIDTYTFELKKKVRDLNAASDSAFKFLINDKFWVEPPSLAANLSMINLDNLFEQVFNLSLDRIAISKEGNHTFFLSGYQDAQKVIVSGTFNNWKEHSLEMQKQHGGWRLQVELPPGKHEYRFIVDGHWMEDPANTSKVVNQFGEFNSLISKQRPVSFTLKDEGYKEVFLAGDFSNWQYNKIPMRLKGNRWSVTLPLSYGKFHYKFIVDGEWIMDPNNETCEYGDGDHLNSVIFVK